MFWGYVMARLHRGRFKRCWVDGRWQLASSKRILGLVNIVGDLRDLRCGYFEPLRCLLGLYRDLSIALDDGRVKFDDCKHLLMAVEDLFDDVVVARFFVRHAKQLNPDEFYFAKSRGLLGRDFGTA